MLTAILLFVIAICAVGAHEYFDKAKQIQELREITVEGYLKDFSWLLNYYEEGCVTRITEEEVKEVQELLDCLASRIAVYYPGFTAPTLA